MKLAKLLYEIKIYHGDNHGTRQLKIKMMMQKSANNQEGVGIYFSDLIDTAEKYAKDVIWVDINKNNFVESRDPARSHISKSKFVALLKEMIKIDKEEMFYFLSDYAYIEDPEDIDEYVLLEAAPVLLNNEIRNLQVELATVIGVESFVKLWNKIIRIDGTYHSNGPDIWYAIINPKYKVNKK